MGTSHSANQIKENHQGNPLVASSQSDYSFLSDKSHYNSHTSVGQSDHDSLPPESLDESPLPGGSSVLSSLSQLQLSGHNSHLGSANQNSDTKSPNHLLTDMGSPPSHHNNK